MFGTVIASPACSPRIAAPKVKVLLFFFQYAICKSHNQALLEWAVVLPTFFLNGHIGCQGGKDQRDREAGGRFFWPCAGWYRIYPPWEEMGSSYIHRQRGRGYLRRLSEDQCSGGQSFGCREHHPPSVFIRGFFAGPG